MTLLLSAAEKGHEDVVRLLLETGKVNPELEDSDGWTPLSKAVEGRSVAVIQLLLDQGAKTDYWYLIVSESKWIVTGLIANTSILDYCSG